MLDPIRLAFIALDDKWDTKQREYYPLQTRKEAVRYLERLTGENFGYNRFRWAIYFLRSRRSFTGFRVLFDKLIGANERFLKYLREAEDDNWVL